MMKASETLEMFEAWIVARGKTDSYAKWCRGKMNTVIRDMNDFDIHTITKEAMTIYLVNLRKRLKRTSFDSYKRAMKVYFGWSSSHYGFTNPLEDIPYPTTFLVEELDMKITTYRKLWTVADERNRALLAFALSSMARAMEIVQLRTDKANTAKNHQRIIGKGQKSRFIYWDAFAWEHIQKWISKRNFESDWVFTSYQKPEPLSYWGMREIMRRMAKKAGLKVDDRTNWHAVRHLGAVEGAKKGMSDYELAQRLGNTATEVNKRYAHFRPDTMKQQSEKYDLVRGVLND